MKLNNGFMVALGEWEAMIYGGPFKNFDPTTRRLIGVKMAVEINHPHDLSVPTRDYSVPKLDDLEDALKEVFRFIRLGNDIYVGCMGGVGRTGLFMGCLLKCIDVYEGKVVDVNDIVGRVRKMYNSHAVETNEQKEFIGKFDVSYVVSRMNELFDPPVAVTEVKEVEKVVVEKIVEKVVVERLITPWEWCLRFWR